MSRKLHVENLSYLVETEELNRLFAGHGDVRSVELVGNHATSPATGTAFVEMDSDEHGKAAITALNGMKHRGFSLIVGWAKTGEGKRLSSMFGS